MIDCPGGSAVTGQFYTQVGLLAPLTGGSTYTLQPPVVSGTPFFSQVYNLYDSYEDLVESDSIAMRTSGAGKWSGDGLFPLGALDGNANATSDYDWTITTGVYNAVGKPLTTTVQTYTTDNLTTEKSILTNYPQTSVSTGYAYWDQAKFWQQKAVVNYLGTSNQTIAYTDYYPSGSGGSTGQVYKTFSSAFSTFTNGPSGDTNWRNDILPSAGAAYASTINYDAQGRATDTWILHSTSPSNAYVQTHMSYFGDNATGYGEPQTVVEDYGGSGHANRTTTTVSYDSAGRATETIDAALHDFKTDYDLDGKVNSVKRVDSGLNQTIVSYTYGNVGMETGQVSTVSDGLSGVGEVFGYSETAPASVNQSTLVVTGGGGDVGQVTNVSESWPGSSGYPNTGYRVDYTFTQAGERNTAKYTTAIDTQTWQYADYCSTGKPASPGRAFQTMRQLDSSGNPTTEEMHYQYDGGGRLEAATFGMTPASGFTPSSGQPWYDGSHLPSSRARVFYDNDARGCLWNLEYRWDKPGAGTSTPIEKFHCVYDGTTGQKSDTYTYYGTIASQTWNTGPHETYSYDTQRGFLTAYTTNDGATDGQNPPHALPSSSSWTYDAAGNRTGITDNVNGTRTDSVVDNLNITHSIQGVTTNYDPLGNRTSKGSVNMTWDCLNRMATYGPSTAISNYSYRADGLRTRKYVPGSTNYTTTYAYDGQMGFEDVTYSVSGSTFTRTNTTDYALGARGVDRWTQSSNNGVYFPIYDAHGNQVSFISRSGSSYWQAGVQRICDPWGILRGGGGGFNPYNRYCGNLGHKNDDESNLTYMRARYYDQASGRFISRDPAFQTTNLYVYCNNDPIGSFDPDGKSFVDILVAFWIFLLRLPTAGSAALTVQETKDLYELNEAISSGFEGVAKWKEYFDLAEEAVGDIIPEAVGSLEADAEVEILQEVSVFFIEFELAEQRIGLLVVVVEETEGD